MQRIPPDRQRAFEAARRQLEELSIRRGKPLHPLLLQVPTLPEAAEHARYWLIKMGEARGTPGGLAIATLARRGYGISSLGPEKGRPVPLDRPGLVEDGALLPQPRTYGLWWKHLEAAALAMPVEELPAHRISTGHEQLAIVERLEADLATARAGSGRLRESSSGKR